jgi:hypothetical protein
MKKITFSVQDDLLERAKTIARSQRRTLNAAFREWLKDYTSRAGDVRAHLALMERLKHIDSGGRYSRDELNER